MTDLRNIRFGVEIETFGLGQEGVARTLAREFGWRQVGTSAIDLRGRTWKAVHDGSIRGPREAEVVTPVLEYGDLETLQEVVRKLRAAGARVNDSCGIHIHVDAAAFDTAALVRLVKLFAGKEQLLKHALGVIRARGESYCWDMNREGFLDRLYAGRAPKTLDDLNRRWYGQPNTSPRHYDHTRYHALNLHNVWYRGTVEFRLFNSSLHAGKVKAYIQFCLALAAKAINAHGAAGRPRTAFNPETAKYDFRTFLLRLGLIGDEFKTCRLHLTKHLAGNASWKNGRPARPEDTIRIADEPAGDEQRLEAAGWERSGSGEYWIHPNYNGLYTTAEAMGVEQRRVA